MPEAVPQLSLVMPCYNEAEVVGYSISRLLGAFERAGYRVELVAVDNGSTDRTGEIIRTHVARNRSVVHHRIEVNDGYGNGILSGIPLCTAPWVGIIAADGQVDAEDVVRLFEAVTATNGSVLGKVRRRFRMDGLARKVISVAYNLFMLALWPRLGTLDVNGNPKILRREDLLAMRLRSRGWLLDPEMMIKAHLMGLRVLEFNVFARMRGGGTSHVRVGTCWEFFHNVLRYRFSRELAAWKQEVVCSPAWQAPVARSSTPPAA